MRARDLNTIEDLALSVPALTLQVDASAKDRTIRIRRIGTVTSAAAGPSVSTVLDSVVLLRGGQQTARSKPATFPATLAGGAPCVCGGCSAR